MADPPESLERELVRKLYEALAATPSVRAAFERGEHDVAVNLSEQEGTVITNRVMWTIIEHSLRTSEEVDRLRRLADLDEEPRS